MSRKHQKYLYSFIWTLYVLGFTLLYHFGRRLPLTVIESILNLLPHSWNNVIQQLLSSDFGRFGGRISSFLWLIILFIVSTVFILRKPWKETPLATRPQTTRYFFSRGHLWSTACHCNNCYLNIHRFNKNYWHHLGFNNHFSNDKATSVRYIL